MVYWVAKSERSGDLIQEEIMADSDLKAFVACAKCVAQRQIPEAIDHIKYACP